MGCLPGPRSDYIWWFGQSSASLLVLSGFIGELLTFGTWRLMSLAAWRPGCGGTIGPGPNRRSTGELRQAGPLLPTDGGGCGRSNHATVPNFLPGRNDWATAGIAGWRGSGTLFDRTVAGDPPNGSHRPRAKSADDPAGKESFEEKRLGCLPCRVPDSGCLDLESSGPRLRPDRDPFFSRLFRSGGTCRPDWEIRPKRHGGCPVASGRFLYSKAGLATFPRPGDSCSDVCLLPCGNRAFGEATYASRPFYAESGISTDGTPPLQSWPPSFGPVGSGWPDPVEPAWPRECPWCPCGLKEKSIKRNVCAVPGHPTHLGAGRVGVGDVELLSSLPGDPPISKELVEAGK